MPLKTLFLNPPSFENFDGGAGSRWPATREIESYWYPVWLAYPTGMLEGARLLDAPPHHISADQTIEIAADRSIAATAIAADARHLNRGLIEHDIVGLIGVAGGIVARDRDVDGVVDGDGGMSHAAKKISVAAIARVIVSAGDRIEPGRTAAERNHAVRRGMAVRVRPIARHVSAIRDIAVPATTAAAGKLERRLIELNRV